MGDNWYASRKTSVAQNVAFRLVSRSDIFHKKIA